MWMDVDRNRWTQRIDPETGLVVVEDEPIEIQEGDMEFPQLDELSTEEQASGGNVDDTKPTAEKMAFIGVGQAGCKIADEFWKSGYRRVLLLNTTEQDMAGLECPNRLIIGKLKSGAGKNPAAGAQAATESKEEILRTLYKSIGSEFERVMICSSSGGGTGSGAMTVLVDIAKQYFSVFDRAPKVGAIVAGPKKAEGQAVGANHVKLMVALRALTKEKAISPLVLVDNDRISKMFPKASITSFHNIANRNVVGLFNVFNELAAQSSPYSTLDPADYKSVLDGGALVFGMTVVANPEDATALAAAIEKNTTGGLLSDIALKGATHAGAVLVASPETLGKIPQSNLDLAFKSLARVLGGDALVLHQGVYEGPESLGGRAMFYSVVSGMEI